MTFGIKFLGGKRFLQGVWLLGFLIFLGILIFRTTGIHSDEVNYLRISERYFFGDSSYSRKPCLFYMLSFLFAHSLGQIFGPLYAWSFYITSALLISLGLVWAIQPIYIENKKLKFLLIYLVLLCSPLVAMNSTQFMMETPLIFLLALIFGSMVRNNSGASNWIFAIGFIAVSIKSTAVCALAVLIIAFWNQKRRECVALILAIFASSVFSALLVHISSYFPLPVAHPEVPPYHLSLMDMLNPDSIFRHMRMTSFYLYAWAFFVGLPALVGGLAFLMDRIGSKKGKVFQELDSDAVTFLKIAVISWAVTFSIQMVSTFFYVRYAHPAFFVGLLAGVYLLDKARVLVLVPLLAITLFQSYALVGREPDRFEHWPTITNAEFFHAPLTIFYGTPTHSALIGLRMHESDPCVQLDVPETADLKGWYARYLQFVFQRAQASSDKNCSKKLGWSLDVKRVVATSFDSPEPIDCKGQGFMSYQEIIFPIDDDQTRYLNSTCISAPQVQTL